MQAYTVISSMINLCSTFITLLSYLLLFSILCFRKHKAAEVDSLEGPWALNTFTSKCTVVLLLHVPEYPSADIQTCIVFNYDGQFNATRIVHQKGLEDGASS